MELYSLERRRELSTILYIAKSIIGRVPNPGIVIKLNPRTGYHITVPKIEKSAPASVSKIRRSSLQYRGAQLFNCLPIELRSSSTLSRGYPYFRSQLVIFLQNVPDQPTVPGLHRAAASNSLIDQVMFTI